MAIKILAADSVTALGPEVRGNVLVAGSHGGRIAAYLGAAAGAHALILNDAGVGKDEAGIAGLADLDTIGMAAATVAHSSARIGDGADTLARGVITHANVHAQRVGVVIGMTCASAAHAMTLAPAPHGTPAPYSEGRFALIDEPPVVWALDSTGKLAPEDAGRILIIGSHCALLGGRPESALTVAAHGAFFHDAGGGAAGTTRLPALDARGMPAAAVAAASARIGDGRSLWATGQIAVVNATASALGITIGMSVRDAVRRMHEKL